MRMFYVIFVVLLLAGVVVARGFQSKHVTVLVTAYCPCPICCGDYADGVTATMRDASLPGVAVDPRVIGLGARLDIPDYGNWVLADDVGGAIKGHHIDVRMDTHEEAVQWGRKRLKIRVWE